LVAALMLVGTGDASDKQMEKQKQKQRLQVMSKKSQAVLGIKVTAVTMIMADLLLCWFRTLGKIPLYFMLLQKNHVLPNNYVSSYCSNNHSAWCQVVNENEKALHHEPLFNVYNSHLACTVTAMIMPHL
jgi:hypothetical protein